MGSHLPALLALSALAGALSQADLCEYETNKIKDLLQASCIGRGLTKVPPGLDTHTGILLLGSNRLSRVSTASFWHLHNLTDLDLSHNGMEDLVAASPLPGLQELDLSHNALRHLPALQGFPNLSRLALGHNALSRLPERGFRALTQLVDLQLQGNQLQSLPEAAFAGLSALKDLDLSDNRLRTLPPELLSELGALETLRLERNQLRSIPEGFFPEGQLFAYVYLVGNPWLCDCALEYLRDWIGENSFSVYTRLQGPEKEITENEPERVTCQEPPEELGKPVMSFQGNCRLEGHRGGLGDEEEEEAAPELQTTTVGPDMLSSPSFPVTTAVSPTQSTPSWARSTATLPAHSPATATPGTSPPGLGTLATTRAATGRHSPAPTTATSLAHSQSTSATIPATTLPATPAASTSGPSPAPTTAIPPVHSQSTSPRSLGTLATSLPAATAMSTLGLSPVPTRESASPPSTCPQAMSTRQATPVASPTALLPPDTARLPLPAPPAYCQCPLLPGTALGLSRQQPTPMSWGAWLAAHCCPLRLALYVVCLLLVPLSMLAMLCWWGWVWVGTCYSDSRLGVLGHQQLQKAGCERRQGPDGGCHPLPGRRLYRAYKMLEMGPLRYVSWLLISLPGPSGQWPWERKGSWDGGEGDPGAQLLTSAASRL